MTALDHNPAMLAASEATYLRQTSEQFILGDWLDERPGTFDAIVGDKVFDNVRPSDWGELIVRLGQVLKPAHPLVVRVAPVNRDLLGYTFSDLLQQWARRYECGAVSLEDAAAGLWEEALGASTTALPGLQTVARFTHEIATLRAASLSNWEANVLTQYEVSFGASIDESWTAYTLGALIDALDGFFRLLHVRYSTDYMAAQRQPILAFERRALNTRTEAHT